MPHVCVLPKPGTGFHMSWSFCVQWFEVRVGCSYCWYLCNCWPSLFKLFFDKKPKTPAAQKKQIKALFFFNILLPLWKMFTNFLKYKTKLHDFAYLKVYWQNLDYQASFSIIVLYTFESWSINDLIAAKCLLSYHRICISLTYVF